MAEPIRKPKDFAAPTPQNTPASVSTLQQPRAGASGPSMASIAEASDLGGLATNPALLSMIKGRLGKLVGKSSGYIESLPTAVRDRLAALKYLRVENSKNDIAFQREIQALEKKYLNLNTPLYERRAKIIAGEMEPSRDEISKGHLAFDKEKELFEDSEDEGLGSEVKDEDDDEVDEVQVKGIPCFWLTALKNLPQVSDMITDRDDDVLQYLSDVRLKYLDVPGFALEFEFSDNEFFTNKVLKKTYFYIEDPGFSGDFIYDHAEGDEIKWTSPDKNVTVKIEKRKQRNKHTKATRVVEKSLPVDSFFNFFSPPKVPDDEDDEYDDDIHDELEFDFDIGELIKEQLIPRAIDWFTGKAQQYGEVEDEEHINDSGDDEDEQEDGIGEAGSKQEAPSDCKQQ